jgi:hypothetical protein
MKKLIGILFLLVPFMYSQTVDSYELHGNQGLELYFYGAAMDSGANYTASFEDVYPDWLDYWQGVDIATYSVGYEYFLDTLTANDEILGIFIQGRSNINTWTTIDTILATDTLNASHAGLTGKGLTKFNVDHQYSFPEYRVFFDCTGFTASANTFTGKLSLYLRKRN